MNKKEIIQRCAEFHGHICPGLLIGVNAALYAQQLLNLKHAEDEETVCISENDACGVDAIQVILGTSIGKGNLLFHMTGKDAYSFYNRKTGRSVRLILKPLPEGKTRDELIQYLTEAEPSSLFDAMDTRIPVPEEASIFHDVRCEVCGEMTSEKYIRIQDGKKVCPDCFRKYNRFEA